MISRSLAAFIGSKTELAGAGLGITGAYAQTPDLALSELQAPYALVGPLHEAPQELWAIGDAQRQEKPLFEVSFYCKSDEQARQFEARFRRLIESATATDANSITHPGIDFMAYADLLRDSGDHKLYYSDQLSWFSTPTPVVYVNEDSNGEPIVVASGYTVDSAAGTVTFATANAAADRVRATYKVGVIDFVIGSVAHFATDQQADIANNPARYVCVFGLESFFYVKAKANRWL